MAWPAAACVIRGTVRRVKAFALAALAACGAPPASALVPAPPPWSVPAGWRSELIPFPLEFAPSLAHHGLEEIRFASGFFDPHAPGYWSYAFAWRLDAQPLDASALGGELTIYFRGLIDAVDDKHEITDRNSIIVRAAARATAAPASFTLSAHVFDAFTTKQAVELSGTAARHACAIGEIWVFVLAPAQSAVRAQLDALAAQATCDQPVVQSKPRARP